MTHWSLPLTLGRAHGLFPRFPFVCVHAFEAGWYLLPPASSQALSVLEGKSDCAEYAACAQLQKCSVSVSMGKRKDFSSAAEEHSPDEMGLSKYEEERNLLCALSLSTREVFMAQCLVAMLTVSCDVAGLHETGPDLKLWRSHLQ